MKFSEIKKFADDVAKMAMLYIPFLFIVTAFVILCVAAKTEWLPAALFLDLMGCFSLLVFALVPSYLMDIIPTLIKYRDTGR